MNSHERFCIALEKPEEIYPLLEIAFRKQQLPLYMLAEAWQSGESLKNYPTPSIDAVRKNGRLELGRGLFPHNLFSELKAYMSIDGLRKTYRPTFKAFYGSIPQASWDKDILAQFMSRLFKLYKNIPVHPLQTVDDLHGFRIDHPLEKIANYVFLGFEDGQEFQLHAEITEKWAKSMGLPIHIENRPRISFVLYPIETPPLDIISLNLFAQQLQYKNEKPESFSAKMKAWGTDVENVLRIIASVKREELKGTFTLRAPEL